MQTYLLRRIKMHKNIYIYLITEGFSYVKIIKILLKPVKAVATPNTTQQDINFIQILEWKI